MKEGNFLISEKLERITIRSKRTHKQVAAICKHCGKQFDWLTVNEAAKLFGKDAAHVRKKLEDLRRKIDEHDRPENKTL